MARTASELYDDTNHLVLNFYPDGYTIAIKLNEFPVFTSETILETSKISYEETSLLDYIENEELPPLLVEMIDASPKLSRYKIWHNGCLILEIRDKFSKKNNNNNINNINNNDNSNINAIINNVSNDNGTSSCDINIADSNNIDILRNLDKFLRDEVDPATYKPNSHTNDSNNTINQQQAEDESNKGLFILLKPTNLSMINDVQNLTDSDLWSSHDRLQLESKIVLHSSPFLSLEPKSKEDANTNDDKLIQCHKLQTDDLSWPYKKPNNAFTRLKKKLPNRRRSQTTSNGGGSNPPSITSRNNNVNCPIESLPPEFSLQQFITNKRSNKKRIPPGQMPRFHRFSFFRG